jgi:hypothetical protein
LNIFKQIKKKIEGAELDEQVDLFPRKDIIAVSEMLPETMMGNQIRASGGLLDIYEQLQSCSTRLGFR